MAGDRHLHIDKNDYIIDLLNNALLSAKRGTIKINIENQPAIEISIDNSRIRVDLQDAKLLKIPEDRTGLFDKLRTAKEFAQKLADYGLTIYFLRKGRNAITLGSDARPSISKLVTKSKNIQINSMKEAANLKQEFKTD